MRSLGNPSRRTVVAGLAGAGAMGVGAGVAGTLGAQQIAAADTPEPQDAAPALATAKVGFFGHRQAGIDTAPPAFGSFIGFNLAQDATKNSLQRLLRIITSDAAKLTQGQGPIVDQEPELAEIPASLTVTVGFGEKIFELTNPAKKPSWLKPLPAFEKIDRLEEKWGSADLLVQLCCDDRLTLAHAQRMLLKDMRSFGTVAWVQDGFRRAFGSQPAGQTQRNLFGQVDGTVNPSNEDGTMDQFVWGEHEDLQPWEPGGTSLVLRRIHMNLDAWDRADRPAREDAVGRRLDTGAPLTGHQESDVADFSATDGRGFTVVAPYAHIRRAAAQTPVERFLRRPYNYDLPVFDAAGLAEEGAAGGGVSNAGLLFAAYQADPVKQFVPVQKRLAELDMLNTWTTPIGSAVFAIPAGCSPEGFIGDSLFAESTQRHS
ncbi:Dyp-type peroxidase [Rothia sp. LK2588]|uniref:Dyp-type peroxidase n=1 Tax=Rothia sp. LK2588 TaxID=3114369 RepID=UPI0034CF6610